MTVASLVPRGFMLRSDEAAVGLFDVVICTGDGVLVLTIGPDGEPVEPAGNDAPTHGDREPHKKPCFLGGMLYTLTEATSLSIGGTMHIASGATLTGHQSERSALDTRTRRSRAPPA